MYSDMPGLTVLDPERGWNQRNEILSSFVKSYFSGVGRPLDILEAGCGKRLDVSLEGIPHRITGIDINRHALEFRQKRIGDLDIAILGDLRTARFEKESFDIICNINVLEHIDGAEDVVSSFLDWLRPGGIIIIVLPDRDTVFGRLVRVLPQWVHVFFYKRVLKAKYAGEEFGPYPVYYDMVVSRKGIHKFCDEHEAEIILEYGRPYNLKKLGSLAPLVGAFFGFIQTISFRRLSADYVTLIYAIKKKGMFLKATRELA